MRLKYKLIKEYPGSPKLKTITSIDTEYLTEDTYRNFPEFWEKVEEKEEVSVGLLNLLI